MYFHLILTDDCNLCCSYCRAKAFQKMEESEGERALIIDEKLPVELNINLPVLYDFLKKDPSPALTFYGGEPLLRSDLIEEIVREAPVQRFMMQTNGILLDRLRLILSTVLLPFWFPLTAQEILPMRTGVPVSMTG